MSERSSFYARVRLSPEAFRRFLKAPIPPVSQFQDWDVIASHVPQFLGKVRYPGLNSNEEWLIQLANRIGTSAGWTYDPAKQELNCYDLWLDESVIEYVSAINVVRALADFKDTPGDDYAVIFPMFWTWGVEVVCQIGRGNSSLHKSEPDSGEFREFFATADAESRKIAFGDEGG